MNPAPPQQMENALPDFTRAVVDCPSAGVKWVFPVCPGVPEECVRDEIARRLGRAGNGELLQNPDCRILYPDGAFVGLPNVPVIEMPRAERRPLPPQGGSGTAPPQGQRPQEEAERRPRETGLPPAPPESRSLTMMGDLEALLSQWRARHAPTSAEYYMALTAALARHATTLVRTERHFAGLDRQQENQGRA